MLREETYLLRAVAAVLASIPVAAFGAESAGAFVWDAPEGCPSSVDVRAGIARRVHGPATLGDVRARVLQADDGFDVHMTIAAGERTLHAPTCKDAADAVAVIIAVAADEERARAAEGLAIDRAASDPVQDRAPSARVGSRPSRVRWSVGAAGAVDGASLPRAAPGASLSAEVRRGIVGARVTAAGFLAETARQQAQPRAEATIGLVDVLFAGCFVPHVSSSLDLGACVGGGAGVLYGESRNVSTPGSGIGVRPELVALGRADVRIASGVFLHVDGGALADPATAPFGIRGIGELHRPAALAMRASAGLELSLP